MWYYETSSTTPSTPNLEEALKRLREQFSKPQEAKVESPKVDRPAHYPSPIDPYAYALANNLGPLEMNVVKYLTRWQDKDGLKDLKKARNTLDRLIAHVEGEKK
jgi:hypothetical protein